MTDQMPLEGFEDHTHHHPPQPMPPFDPSPQEAIAAGAQAWLAREFVGGLIAMAQTHEVNVADFLAEKCMVLAMRAASGEAEVEVLRGQVRALQQQVADCPCHDEETVTVVHTDSAYPGMPDNQSSTGPTNNGATST